MMNRFIYFFLLLGCTASALVGCTGDPDVEPLSPGRGDGRDSWVTLDFCDNSFDEVHITTRATLDGVAESRVLNLFVFIFDSDGNRRYGRFFDYKSWMNSEEELTNSKDECWWVEGNGSEEMPYGKVRMKAPAVTGGSLYLLANVNADMVNISPEKLRFVQKLDDLKALTASLNQQVTERNGFFPMTGKAELITVSTGTIKIPVDNGKNKDNVNSDGRILLTRLDAKIVVNLRVANGYRGFTTSGTTSGTTDVKTLHTIKSFVPLSWQVVNLPRTAFVLPRNTDVEDKEMFNTRETKFETRKPDKVSYKQEVINSDLEYEKDASGNIVTKDIYDVETDLHGFSFYMLENRPADFKKIPTKNPNDKDARNDAAWRYHLRDTRSKNVATGAYDTSNGLWEYAPEEGTYLVIKGEIVMALDISDEAMAQQLSADAVYYIHLGNFGSDVDDYKVCRNTSYTYNITIYGVDNIQIEVETSNQKDKETVENESGATGHVYVAKESIFDFDSHYGRKVVSFDEKHLAGVEDLLWYVRTPFGREGAPHVINGVEVPAGLDYQWVHFMINERDNSGNYLHAHAKYDPEKVMNILEFSKYIKEQKKAFDEGEANDFRPEFDAVWYNWCKDNNKTTLSEDKAKLDKTGEWYRNRIYLTIFVDEFYYDANPITGDVRQDLWKDFVNQPDRLMHILCDTEMSKDEASRTTGSVVTIRQHSIQTIFNTEKPELKTAWGCETIDETRDKLWYFSRNDKYNDSDPNGHLIPSDVENSAVGEDDNNGLYNTARIWGVVTWDRYNNVGVYNEKLWSDYVDYDRITGLRDDDKIETLRYSCMTRNRDENGNNIIDAKEIKWYLASINQLGALYVGDQGLNSEAVLYPYYKQVFTTPHMENGLYPWRSHIVSSSKRDGFPEIMWAEEGFSTSPYNMAWGKYAGLSVRCVRNLGMEPSSDKEAENRLKDGNPANNMPERAIKMSGPNENSVYKFDMTNLNPLSIRYYTSKELEPRNEFSIESRVYWAFETGILTERTYTYDELYDLIYAGKSPCPNGYHTPNVREGAIMSMFAGDSNSSRVSTIYSHGLRGNDQDKGSENTENYPNNVINRSNSWVFNGTQINLDNQNERCKVRCVRDIRQ